MITTKNLEDLMDKTRAESLFLKYQKECDLSGDFKIENIDRCLVLSPNTYALLYEIQCEKNIRKVRVNASNEETRERAFAVMNFIQPQFSGPQYFIPKPYFYDLDYNAVAYENVEGKLLIHQLKSPNLEKLINLTALWLKHLHSIKKPELTLPKHEMFFNFEALKFFYPDLAKEGPLLVEELKSRISFDFSKALIHGDFQPNNIIVDENNIAVLDFNDSQIGDPDLDIAKFLTQIKTMLFRFADTKHYEVLKKIFLESYGREYNKENFQIYEKMYFLQILCSLSASLSDNPEAKRTVPEIYKYWEEKNA